MTVRAHDCPTTEESSAVVNQSLTTHTSPRLEALRRSLARKGALLDEKISAHFAAVKAANGQPLNDKRNGASTLSLWDRQSAAIRKLSDGLEITKRAIEREEAAVARVERESESIPEPIKARLADGSITQWRKHPRTFFVTGVDKARMVLTDSGVLAHRYAREITDPEQHRLFARTYNALFKEISSAMEAKP